MKVSALRNLLADASPDEEIICLVYRKDTFDPDPDEYVFTEAGWAKVVDEFDNQGGLEGSATQLWVMITDAVFENSDFKEGEPNG